MDEKYFTQLAGEHSVASELHRRGVAAHLTARNYKAADIMAFSENGNCCFVEVKTKNNKEGWPIKGISRENTVLVLVDLYDKAANERPDFYLLTVQDWIAFLEARLLEAENSGNPTKLFRWGDDNIPHHFNERGNGFKGKTLETEHAEQFMDEWGKIDDILGIERIG